DEEISPDYSDEDSDDADGQTGNNSGPILQGSRNNTMSRFASRILKRYGNTEKAHVAFMEHAQKCDPPLPDSELNTIWNSAVKFYEKKISSSEGYVPPDQYNSDFSDASLKPEDYSDIGEAKVLVKEYGSELRFSAATDYLRYDGDRWVEDVQLVVGLAAIGKVYQEHMIIAYGGGANGKSTFWNTIFRVLGDYAGKLSAEALTMNCKRNIKPEMAELKGRRLIISSEMEEGMRLNTATVKQLCSTDEIQAEKKYKAPFHFVPSHTLVLYTNHLPKVGANDDGIWRRLIVIPFNAKITGDSDIKNYADYLFDHAGSFIMSWIIEGAKKAYDMDFKVPLPKVVEEAIEAYREDNDWLGHFLADCCDIDKAASEKSGELYQAYRAYCLQNGEFTRSTTDFYSSIEKAGFPKKKVKTGSFVYGLKLKEGQDFLE
ncbi:MAG: primase C-terminal domain-containing protein, partial [Clostridia bacterium]|nr:primase C-terminal domain-containing protein [Clostridia bacterium]